MERVPYAAITLYSDSQRTCSDEGKSASEESQRNLSVSVLSAIRDPKEYLYVCLTVCSKHFVIGRHVDDDAGKESRSNAQKYVELHDWIGMLKNITPKRART